MDTRTLAYANVMVLAANAAVLYLCSVRKQPGIRWFSHACAVALVGQALLSIGQPMLGLSILGGFGCVVVAIMLLRWGLEDLLGDAPRHWHWDTLVLAAQWTAGGYFLWIHPRVSAAYLSGSLGQATAVALALRPLWSAAGRRMKARLAALYVLSSYTAFTLIRAVAFSMARRPGEIHGLVVVTIAGEMVYNSLFAMGSIWLTLNAQQERLSEQTRRDALTGVLNYRGLRSLLAAVLTDPRRRRDPVAAVAVDLDFFKRINDAHGHAAGDAALVAVARILKTAARTGDVVARCGGEEFAVVLPGQRAEAAVRVAERMRLAIASAGFHFEGQPIPMTASFGVALTEPGTAGGEDAASELLRRADRALYTAKNAGRNRTVLDGAPAAHAAAGGAP